MGIIVENYTTDQGFLVPQLYIQVSSIRMLKTMSGPNYGMVYSSLAYKSVDEMVAGASPIAIPIYLANVEQFLTADQFYDQTIFGFAYGAIKAAWENAGYTVIDWYPQPPTPTTYIYDCSGYNFRGFNCAGYDKDGYDKDGFNKDGWDREGYGKDGYNAEGYNRQGFDRNGYDKDGYDVMGFDKDGYDREGYDRQGFNKQGYDREGYDKDGYNAEGYDRMGYDREGYNKDGYDKDGCNREHKDKDGNPCPAPVPPTPPAGLTDLSGNTAPAEPQ